MHKIVPAGENSIIIYFGEEIDARLPEEIRFFATKLTNQFSHVIINVIPSYTSLHITYNLNLITYQDFCSQVTDDLHTHDYIAGTSAGKHITIPVYYSPEVGLDLAQLLMEKHLSLDKFITIHSAKEYLVHAIGFAPGFTFLAEVEEQIRAPRLATPRIHIPAGSVGIADNQTGIYPCDSSGGWNIIGRTPVDLSVANANNIEKFSVGDTVKFIPVDKNKYLSLGGRL